MTRLKPKELKPSFHRARMPKSGSMAIAETSRINGMRTCARSASMGATAGSKTLAIIVAQLLKPRCFASRPFLEAISVPVNLTIKRSNCLSSVLCSTGCFRSLNPIAIRLKPDTKTTSRLICLFFNYATKPVLNRKSCIQECTYTIGDGEVCAFAQRLRESHNRTK